jgi:hypothetical protein
MGIGLAAALTASGCTLPPEPLAHRGCSAFQKDCEPARPRPPTVAEGATRHRGRIDSDRTPAAIYLNGRFIGYSPLQHPVGFSSDEHVISLVAVPLFPGQSQQERLIRVPPVPSRVSFFMSRPDAGGPANHNAPVRSDR